MASGVLKPLNLAPLVKLSRKLNVFGHTYQTTFLETKLDDLARVGPTHRNDLQFASGGRLSMYSPVNGDRPLLVRLPTALVFPGPPSAARSHQHLIQACACSDERSSQQQLQPTAAAQGPAPRASAAASSPIVLPAGITVSAERHKRLFVRVESLPDDR